VGSEKQELVERVARSRSFGRAPRLRELLLYITHEALEGRPEELSELRIGVRVFGRPESYNPADDNIVRVSARQLRSKLKEYFESEGRDERLVLDIPKGGYVPVFLVRAEQPAATGPVTVRTGARWWLLAAAIGGAVAVLLPVLWLRQKEKLAEDPPSVWSEMFDSDSGRLVFVLTDSYLAAMRPLRDTPCGQRIKRLGSRT
jgi:hypothetical protein